jgi:hypothetical protein
MATRSHSRGTMRPSFAGTLSLRQQRAQGKAGCPEHPQPVCIGSKHAVVTTVAPENTRLSPRNGFNGFLSAPRRRIPFCHRRLADQDLSKPGRGDLISARLDISNGCQGHTTSPYAATSPNASTGRVRPAEVLAKALKRRSSARWLIAHRSYDLPCDSVCAPDAAASTASHRAFRDDREPPLFRVRRASL